MSSPTWERARSLYFALAMAAAMVSLTGCGDDGVALAEAEDGGSLCSLDEGLLFASLPPDAIPALTLPDMVDSDHIDAAYLLSHDRVLGVVVNGEARAYPHNILWHHEIVNDRIGETWVSISFCPLTGSGLAFDPHIGGERLDLGVSGLLFANNLVMFDRETGEIYGPQLSRGGKCTSFRDALLDPVPVQEMSWARWLELHPDSKVVGGETGHSRSYRSYPYGTYDQIFDNDLLFPMSVDRSRALKERVLAIRTGGETGRGFPFLELASLGSSAAINESVDGVPTVVFFDERSGASAVAFDARVDGQTLTFDALPGGRFQDQETQSEWRVDGLAVEGPLAGKRLSQHADSFVLFWFAWRAFMPDGTTWVAP